MQEKHSQSSSHAEHVARRAFIKKAAVGAAFAVPVLESLTKSDVLVKSALAATVPTWTITASLYSGSLGNGTVSPASQTVANGGSAIITVTPAGQDPWVAYRIDGGGFIPTNPSQTHGGTYTFTNVQANHTFEAYLDSP
jgi:hypothetical protein